jgi:hypothetical protein
VSDASVRGVTRRELDGWLGESGGETVIVHGFCHPKSEVLVFYMGGMIAVRCKVCNLHVVNIAVDQTTHDAITAYLMTSPPADEAVRLKPSCHIKAGLYLTYGDGKLAAVCGKCKKPIQTLTVRPEAGGV